ncbi:hypothetical protein HJFPF1_02378 [Paramyrothecium foliicola]|nr:hypothetical protein HJFPF1_02378 [Paramyrothecium foliicola]
MSSVASTTAVSASVSAVPTQCPLLYDTPVRDAACAVPYDKENIEHMKDCCNDAEVVAYYSNCGLYCLAQDQSVKDLTDCLYEKKIAYQDVFCRGNETATATGSGTADLAATASASVIASGSDDDSDDKNDSNRNSDSSDSNGSGNGDGDSAASKPGAGILGVTVGALLLSALFGAFQV